jgi:hypothetical protein
MPRLAPNLGFKENSSTRRGYSGHALGQGPSSGVRRETAMVIGGEPARESYEESIALRLSAGPAAGLDR